MTNTYIVVCREEADSQPNEYLIHTDFDLGAAIVQANFESSEDRWYGEKCLASFLRDTFDPKLGGYLSVTQIDNTNTALLTKEQFNLYVRSGI